MKDFKQTPVLLTPYVLERAGCPIHYWVGGPPQRPLVVLMHGATMDHRMFNAQVEALIPDHRVLVWDARGHGRSRPIGDGFSLEQCARDMVAILDALEVETAVVGGQSLGGYIAQHVYMLAPARVRAMVVIGATPLAKAYGRLEIWALKATMPLFRLWPYEHFARTVATQTAQTQPVRDYALAAVQQIDREDFLTIWKAVTLAIDTQGKPDFTIKVPLLLLHGDHDRTGTIRRDMPSWAETEPNATYAVIPDAGHNANQDNPVFTNRVLLDFLRQHVGDGENK